MFCYRKYCTRSAHPAGKFNASLFSRRTAFKQWWNILCNTRWSTRWGSRFTCEARVSRSVINGLKAREDLSDMAHFLFPFCSVSLFFFSFIFFSFFFLFFLSTKRLSVGEVCQSRATVPMRSRFISGTSE